MNQFSNPIHTMISDIFNRFFFIYCQIETFLHLHFPFKVAQLYQEYTTPLSYAKDVKHEHFPFLAFYISMSISFPMLSQISVEHTLPLR